ncbi:MAG: hypothetical protein ABI585_13735 [Betaproteobacteria bacterium]
MEIPAGSGGSALSAAGGSFNPRRQFAVGPERRAMNILDPKFRYIDSYSTDLRKTFARLRREAREGAKPTQPARERSQSANVVMLERARKAAP